MSEPAPPDEDRAVDDRGREFIARHHRFPANGPGFMMAPVLWFVYFLAVSSLQGIGCAGNVSDGGLRLLLGLLTLVAAITILLLGWWSYRSWKGLLDELDEQERQRHGHSTFLAYGALLHAGLFFVATLWIGIPILLLDPCTRLVVTP